MYQKADYIYRQILLFLFTIDLLIFSIGYCTELAMLNNKIRTVEVTPLGIFVCLICYPPFNNVTSAIIGGNLTDAALTPNPVLTFIGRVLILFFTLIFVLASVALGTKGSNLTNRGIVSKFPYNIVRHPAYASKISFWFIALMMLLYNNNYDLYFLHSFETIANIIFIIVSFSITVFIYYMRAITEERHLMQDPEYREYADKVKYRFIPYII